MGEISLKFHSYQIPTIPTKFLPFRPNSYHSDQIPLGSAWNAWLRVKYSIIPGDVLSEGEREKVIQHTKSNVVNMEEPGDDTVSDQAESKEKQEPQPSNSVPFPSTPK